MPKRVKTFFENRQLKQETQRALSLIFLTLSGTMSLLEYTKDFLIPLKIFERSLTFRPSLITAVLAICLISPLYLRGIFKWKKSLYSIIFFLLTLLVISSFIELAVGGNEKNKVMWLLIVTSIILSWIGIRSIASVCWIVVMATGIVFAIENSSIMGFWGFIYISFAFLGFLLHTELNPGELIFEFKREYNTKFRENITNI